MSNNNLLNILYLALGVLLLVLVVLVIIAVIISTKQKKARKKMNERNKGEESEKTFNNSKEYTKHSVFDFMEFDKIEDNMIIQKKGKRFLMVLQCQGVNYDLMTQEEKIAVEEGFVQFLNTLRYPIQLYIQTRTVNLNQSLEKYKRRVDRIGQQLNRMTMEYNQMKNSENFSFGHMKKYQYELTKQTNLYEYGKDIIYNTERMSQNRNVLTKKYYIVIPYYLEENNGEYDNEELSNMAFSELYTRAQSIMGSLSPTGVESKILDSNGLVELLYIAYNRDEAELFEVKKAIENGANSLYSTAPDILDRKMKMLNEKINREAIDLANSVVTEVKNKKEKEIKKVEESLDDLIKETAKLLIEENEEFIGEEIAEDAKEEINEMSKGGKDNDKKTKASNGRRNKKQDA